MSKNPLYYLVGMIVGAILTIAIISVEGYTSPPQFSKNEEVIEHIELPPVQYDHYDPKKIMSVLEVPIDEVDLLARGNNAKDVSDVLKTAKYLAVTFMSGNVCLTILPKIGSYSKYMEFTVTRRIQETLWRHERAHCSGWPGNHPDAWFAKTPLDLYDK